MAKVLKNNGVLSFARTSSDSAGGPSAIRVKDSNTARVDEKGLSTFGGDDVVGKGMAGF